MPEPGRARRFMHRLLRRLYGSTVGVATDRKLVALTFDDGPDPEWTPRLLEVLAAHGAKATFFMVGSRAARLPGLVARVAAEGHEIGNHSWDHPSLPTLPSAAVAEQLRRTRAVLAPHGGPLMRPPYGDQTLRTHRIARRLGYRPVFWMVNGEDWCGRNAETLAAKLERQVAPGAIVLLHDSLYSFEDPAFRDRTATIDAVAALLQGRRDTRFVTVSELLAHGRARERYWVKLPEAGWLERMQTAP